jgi:L-asparaginase / beta-aspartyl-peptidase
LCYCKCSWTHQIIKGFQFSFFFHDSYEVAAQYEPVVLIHGGAGSIGPDRIPGKEKGMKLAVSLGYKKLMETNSVIDAVEEAVRSMELDEYFNAGFGSVLNSEGNVQMDASIMNGLGGEVGCVAVVENIMHPISLARRVMERTPHNFLAGAGAMEFARQQGIEFLPRGELVSTYANASLELWNHMLQNGLALPTDVKNRPGEVGTVGAVAIDRFGNLAAATSTGGMTGKLPGRVGDTPLVGGGTYCDNRYGCVSTTGHGETIMKVLLAHDIVNRIQYQWLDAQNATQSACDDMTTRYTETAGAITIDRNGNVGIGFSSPQMAWAYQKQNTIYYGINKGETFQEDVMMSSVSRIVFDGKVIRFFAVFIVFLILSW